MPKQAVELIIFNPFPIIVWLAVAGLEINLLAEAFGL